MQILKELQRRNVIRVALLYVVGSWLILQIGDLLFDLMGLPDFALRIVLGILLLGFPVALVFSWIYEITPEGVKRDTGGDADPSPAATSRKLNIAVIVTVLLAVSVLLADRFLYRGEPNAGESGTAAETAQDEAAAEDVGESPATGAAAAPDPASVAVLPFLNLSSDPDQEYFSDGLADTLLHRLAQVADLRVAARTSAFQFKGRNEDVRDIASALGVATVLEGSVQRQGSRVRITAQLIRGDDGTHLWSRVFDDTLDDIFRVQDEISTEVTAALAATLLDTPAAQAMDTEAGGTEVVAAYEAYLRGRKALDRGTPEGANEAVAQLELAVELDPGYALAWAYLVDAYGATASLGNVAWEATREPQLRAAERAVRLAPDLVDAHLALSSAMASARRHQEAIAAAERAYELGPNNAAAVRVMALISSSRGRYRDALRLTERAVQLDPLDPTLRMNLAEARMAIGNDRVALAEGRALVAQHPDNLELQARIGWMMVRGEQPVAAMEVFQSVYRSHPEYLRVRFFLTQLWYRFGDGERALYFLEQAEARAPDRAIDDRMNACYAMGMMDCYREAASRYISYQRESGDDFGADHVEALLLLRTGRPAEAVPMLERLVISDGTVDVRFYNAAEALALAYDLAGDTASRDRVLDELEANLTDRINQGLSPRWIADEQVRIAVLRDDSQRALDMLSTVFENSPLICSLELENKILFRKLKDHPDFPAVKAQLQEREARWREAVSDL